MADRNVRPTRGLVLLDSQHVSRDSAVPARTQEAVMARLRGRMIPVTPGRRLVAELLQLSRQVPLLSIRRDFFIPALVAARHEADPPISWVAVFTKAYALLARGHPHL